MGFKHNLGGKTSFKSVKYHLHAFKVQWQAIVQEINRWPTVLNEIHKKIVADLPANFEDSDDQDAKLMEGCLLYSEPEIEDE